MLYEILKTSKLGASFAPDMYTALWAQKLARDGEVKTLSGAPPLSFKANGQPLLDYLISGNTVQSGTPTHDNPVMPQGTGERTWNLYNTTATDWALGILDDNGQPTGSTSSHYTTNYTEVSPQTAYVLSGTISTTDSLRVYFYSSDKSWISRTVQKTTGDFTTPQNCFYIRIQVTVTIDDTSDWMLNLGSTALPYEPYGYKIPISSAGTTTPVYLGEVETTRRIKKLVLDGTENFSNQYGTNLFSVVIQPLGKINFFNSYCTHYKYNPVQSGLNTNTQNGEYALQVQSTQTLLAFKDTSYSSAADFKSYLAAQYAAGTPVTVWYVLATPTTGIVNEPLMKIGEYADTVSMEQAGVEIPTVRGTNTLDVLTDVKPSEVYIKYKE